MHPVWKGSLVCLIVFLFIVVGITQSQAVQNIDQDGVEAVYNTLPLFWCEFLEWWSNPGLYVLGSVMALVLLLKRQWALLVLGIVLAGGGKFLESTLKTMVERPRPVYADAELAARSYSFPSGNTLLALILYGFLIYLILPFMQTKQTRTMLISLGIVWIVLIAISRVVLGDHYPGDVLGSLALGGAWLGFGIGISERYHFLLDNR